MKENKIIQLKNIEKSFGKKDFIIKALSNITIDIFEGEMVAIMGASGSGKSTLLNIIGCLDTQTSGDYYLYNKNVSKMSSKEKSKLRCSELGFIVQDFALINEYSVYKNIILPCIYSKMNKKAINNRAKALIKQLKIDDKTHSYPSQLSGGQKQRTAIARALMNDPKIILADEPTGSLDQQNGHEVIKMLKHINNEGKTVIIVTHDPNIALECNRIIYLCDGKITQKV